MRLHSVLRGAHSYLPADATLAGMTANEPFQRPENAEHSIAEIVAHMAFWQQWFLERCDGLATPAPARAELGWPAVTAMPWEAVYERFDSGFKRALALAADEERTAQAIAPPLEFGHLAQYTVGDALIHLALHNAHHLGQIITLRQLMGTWPPPAGRWTW
jgi:uncharacterized damage-inducible protein DinB